MRVAFVAAISGVLVMWASMLQATPLTVRYLCMALLIASEIVFLLSFLSLGTRG